MTRQGLLPFMAIMAGGITGNFIGVALDFRYGGFVGAAVGGILALYNAYLDSK